MVIKENLEPQSSPTLWVPLAKFCADVDAADVTSPLLLYCHAEQPPQPPQAPPGRAQGFPSGCENSIVRNKGWISEGIRLYLLSVKQPGAGKNVHGAIKSKVELKRLEGDFFFLKKKKQTYLLDIINIARHNHLLWVEILIKVALIIFSIWILVDMTEKSPTNRTTAVSFQKLLPNN